MGQDQTIVCADCNQEFTFTAGEQEFFKERGFNEPPKRCNDCRKKRKANGSSASGGGSGGGRFSGRGRSGHSGADRPKFSATCSRCGASFDAPFQPKPDRPVFCRPCFEANGRTKS